MNSYRRRLKPSANPLINLSILVAAFAWNLLHLPETIQIARQDQRAALEVQT